MDVRGRGGGGDGAAVSNGLVKGRNFRFEERRCLIMFLSSPSFSCA